MALCQEYFNLKKLKYKFISPKAGRTLCDLLLPVSPDSSHYFFFSDLALQEAGHEGPILEKFHSYLGD